MVGVFQMIPKSSTTSGIPTQYQPLLFIVIVSGLRAATEDWNKHKADNKRNSFKYEVLKNGSFVSVESGSIRVGNIVKIKQDEMVPCDVLFLASALEKGHCFIDKANLNGETKLEVETSLPATRVLCRDAASMDKLHLSFMYEAPTPHFDTLRGIMKVTNGDRTETVNVDGKSLLMRETSLRNCDYIYGLAIYCGNGTKIQMSNAQSGKPKAKTSDIMRKVEKFLLGNVGFQISLCVIAALYFYLNDMKGAYLENEQMEPSQLVFTFLSWFILMSQMVPISLTVTSEMVKFMQSKLISLDVDLFYAPINKRAKCNSSTIHEDLGMVSYIFSDKTGTLTQNKMEFRYALLADGEYGSKETEIAKSVKKRKAELAAKTNPEEHAAAMPQKRAEWTKLEAPLRSTLAKSATSPDCSCCRRGGFCNEEDGTCGCFTRNCWKNTDKKEHVTEADLLKSNHFTEAERKELLRALWGACPPGQDKQLHIRKREQLRLYLTHMALSNTVKPYDDNGTLKFQAESAEEYAMILWARSCGFLKVSQHPTTLKITEWDEAMSKSTEVVEKYNHVGTMGFTSQRARVSMIYECVKGRNEGKVIIMSKGQDTMMFPLLQSMPLDFESRLVSNLELCATNGLRTLLCAEGVQPLSWWAERQSKYQAVVDGGAGDPEAKLAMHNFFETLEIDAKLSYIGCMGMEDQLQLLVPEAIHDFLLGGIKVWMITGDKLETAKNIGIACNLIDPDMQAVLSPDDDLSDCIDKFQNSRLIEVTGQWVALSKDKHELKKLFDSIDGERKGAISYKELVTCLTALKMPEIPASALPDEFKKGDISLDGFVSFMQSTTLHMYDAVKADIEDGINRYNDITDHDAYPITTLINREAFLVMFPPKIVQKDSTAVVNDEEEKKLEDLRHSFFQLASLSKSVVFARAEPAMKKRMVTEIQARYPTAVTLAVGDGANDTDMITAAHVGVGIAGVEGTAASNSADYAIGTFRMLHTLIFVHGFWNYDRMSKLVCIIFFKSLLLAISGYMYGAYSAFSGQQFYNDNVFIFYNVAFTALPVMSVALFGKALNRATLQNNPSTYREQRGAFTKYTFLSWVLRSILYSATSFFIPIYSITGEKEKIDVIFWYSETVVIIMVFVSALLAQFEMTNINFLHWMTLLSSYGSIILFTQIFALTTVNTMGIDSKTWQSPETVMTSILTLTVPVLIEIAWRHIQRQRDPSLTQIMQERVRFGRNERNKKDLDKTKRKPIKVQLEAMEYNEKWGNRALLSERRQKRKTQIRKTIDDASPIDKDNDGDAKLRTQIIRSMLRFRNLTGAQFDSAAQARFQNHDKAEGNVHQGNKDDSKHG